MLLILSYLFRYYRINITISTLLQRLRIAIHQEIEYNILNDIIMLKHTWLSFTITNLATYEKCIICRFNIDVFKVKETNKNYKKFLEKPK